MKKWIKIIFGLIFLLKGVWTVITKEFYGKGLIPDLYGGQAQVLGILDCIIGLVFIYFGFKTPKKGGRLQR